MMKNLFLPILLLLIACSLKGQQNNTLFLMHDLPQANIVNPAVPIDCNLYIGLPGIGSTHINAFSTGFALNDILIPSNDDSLHIELDDALANFKNKEIIATELHLALFSAGYRYRQNYITFTINEKVNSYITLNKNALLLLNGGNTQFEGKNVKMNGTRASAVHYREYALGWARQMDSRLSIGFRFKLLFGKSNLYTEPIKINLYTNPVTFDTYMGGSADVYASLPIDVTVDPDRKLESIEMKDDIKVGDYLMNKDNKGFGFEFGFVYDINDQTTISGSVLDIGYINWNKDSHHLRSDGEVDITGEAIDEGLGNLDGIADSLENVFTPLVNNEAYLSPLVPSVYLGVSHELNSWMNVGTVFHSEFYRGRLHPSLTFSGNASITKNIYGSASYTLQNKRFNNFGAGIGAKFGVFHFHAVSDNIPAFFNLTAAKNVNLRFGVGMLFGCGRKKKKTKDDKGIRAIPCYGDPYHKQRGRPKKQKRR